MSNIQRMRDLRTPSPKCDVFRIQRTTLQKGRKIVRVRGLNNIKEAVYFQINSAYNIRTHRDYDNTHRSNTTTNQTESQHSDGEIGMSSHSPPRRYFQIVTAHEILVISWDSH